VRTPVVPGVNDDEALIGEIREVLDGVPDVTWELLPYHRLGRPKYGYLDRECLVDDEPLDPEVLARLSRG